MASTTPSSENGNGNVVLFVAKFSPYAWRPLIALTEKGIPFTPSYVNVFNKPKELLEANPIYGQVPALLHNGSSVCESCIILEYLEEAWPEVNPLMPKDALAKSKVRFWADYISKGLDSIFWSFREKLGRQRPANVPVVQVPGFLKTLEATMVQYSADGPFFTGDRFGYLDVVMAPLAAWMNIDFILEPPTPGAEQLPRLHNWVSAIKEHKSYRDAIPSDDQVFEFFEGLLKRFQK